MSRDEEREMHDLAARLEALTRGTGWAALQYEAIGRTMEALAKYCAVCDCQKKKP